MKQIYIITIGMITAFLLSIETGYAQKAERKNIRDGNKLYQSEKFTESEVAYRKSVDVNPRSIEGTYNLGNSLFMQGKYQEAAEQYQLLAGQGERMLETPTGKQKLSEVYHNTGNIFMKQKDYAQSVEAYKQSLRLNPNDDETRYNLALAQKLLDDQQNQEENQDQNEDEKEDEQKQDQNQNEEQNQDEDQQQSDEQEDEKPQEENQNAEGQMSQDNAQQILDAFLQDEKDTQEKVKKAQQQMQQNRRTDKEW